MIDYVDPIGIRRDEVGAGAGLGEEMLNTIATADALVAVIRAFEDDSGVECDPEGDYEAIALELLLNDLKKVDNRLERVSAQVQRIGGPDKKRLEDEMHLMEKLKQGLENECPIRAMAFNPDEEKVTRSFQFLTTKPLLVVVNTDENAQDSEALIERLRAHDEKRAAGGGEGAKAVFMALSGKTEMEIAQLPPEERTDFLASYGITESGSAKMIRLSYEALGLISFLTAGPPEAHAWTIPRGATAVEAAGAIHSDLARGFIRAQVVRWDDLLKAGSFGEARKHATLRIEGKEYIVQDGDVIEIMFSV